MRLMSADAADECRCSDSGLKRRTSFASFFTASVSTFCSVNFRFSKPSLVVRVRPFPLSLEISWWRDLGDRGAVAWRKQPTLRAFFAETQQADDQSWRRFGQFHHASSLLSFS